MAQDVRDVHSGRIGGAESSDEQGRQVLAAVIIGAAALSVVMLLILLAAWQAPSSVVDFEASNNKKPSARTNAENLEIDYFAGRTRAGVEGSRELLIEGHVTNKGPITVEAADLRCYFGTDSGKPVYFDFPLVIDTSLDDLGDGPLPPMTGRHFSVRMGEFPDGIASDITRAEVINLQLKNY